MFGVQVIKLCIAWCFVQVLRICLVSCELLIMFMAMRIPASYDERFAERGL